MLKKSYLIVLLTLVNCSLFTPEYKKPNINIPKSWNINESINNNLNSTAWWKNFNDNNLNKLIDIALNQNTDIQKAIGNIMTAQGNLQQINMSWLPTIGLGGIYSVGNTANDSINSPNNLMIPNNQIALSNINNFNFYNYGLIPSYSLNIFKQFNEQNIAKSNLELTIATKDSIKIAIISQVCSSYFTLITTNIQLEIEKSMLNKLSELRNSIQKNYKYGLATTNDVNSIDQKILETKIQRLELENNLNLSKNSLKTLLRNNLESFSFNSSLNNIKIENLVVKNLSSEVLNNRPDVRIAEQQLKIANANIGVARSNFFPKISLTSPLGGYSSQLGNLFSDKGNFWALQIQATMPILNLGLYGIIKEAKGQYYVAYYNYIKTIENSFYDVDNNLNNMDKMKKIINFSENELMLVESITKNNQLKYNNGLISNPENLNSLINNDKITQMYYNNKLKQIQSIIMFYQSIAAGYSYNNSANVNIFNDNHDEK
jgi:multidrug efflux system outer membrane protein